MDPGQLDGDRRRRRRMEEQRAFGQDVALYAFLAMVVLAIGWGMWRLDDRSERLFAIVAAERRAPPACP